MESSLFFLVAVIAGGLFFTLDDPLLYSDWLVVSSVSV